MCIRDRVSWGEPSIKLAQPCLSPIPKPMHINLGVLDHSIESKGFVGCGRELLPFPLGHHMGRLSHFGLVGVELFLKTDATTASINEEGPHQLDSKITGGTCPDCPSP